MNIFCPELLNSGAGSQKSFCNIYGGGMYVCTSLVLGFSSEFWAPGVRTAEMEAGTTFGGHDCFTSSGYIFNLATLSVTGHISVSTSYHPLNPVPISLNWIYLSNLRACSSQICNCLHFTFYTVYSYNSVLAIYKREHRGKNPRWHQKLYKRKTYTYWKRKCWWRRTQWIHRLSVTDCILLSNVVVFLC